MPPAISSWCFFWCVVRSCACIGLAINPGFSGPSVQDKLVAALLALGFLGGSVIDLVRWGVRKGRGLAGKPCEFKVPEPDEGVLSTFHPSDAAPNDAIQPVQNSINPA